jgi:hypothetical protein
MSRGVSFMRTGFVAFVLACGALLFSFSVEASPILVPAPKPAPGVTLVRGFCGLGFHRGPYGYCIRNGTVAVPPVVVAPVVVTPVPVVVTPAPVVVTAPLVVTPVPTVVAPVAPVIVAPLVCPYGYFLGPYGRCLPY